MPANPEGAMPELRAALLDLLGQFDQAHDALGVDRSPSAQEAIANAKHTLAAISEQAGEEYIEGECVEIGSDAEGQPRLIIHATVEALRGHARAILYRNVRVTLAPADHTSGAGAGERG